MVEDNLKVFAVIVPLALILPTTVNTSGTFVEVVPIPTLPDVLIEIDSRFCPAFAPVVDSIAVLAIPSPSLLILNADCQ